MSKFTSSVSPKGQITIPIEIRNEFEPKDSVSFNVVGDVIQVTPLKRRLLKYHQRFKSRTGPLDWKKVERIAREEAAENAAREGADVDQPVN